MEKLDVYDEHGRRTGKVVERGNLNLESNEHIAVAVIYLENSQGQFLIQKTSKEKGEKYSSTGGHITSGDTPLEAIKREVKEELGISIDNEPIEELGYLLYDRPLRYMFYLKKDIDLNDITLQETEVDFVKYMTISEIKQLIENNQFTESHAIIFKRVLEYKNNQ